MSRLLLVNGKAVGAEGESGQWLLSEGSQFGFGLFETLLCKKGRPMDFERHLKRMRKSAQTLGIDLPTLFLEENTKILLEALKPLLTDEDAMVLKLNLLKYGSSSHWMALTRPNVYEARTYAQGFNLGLSNTVRHSKGLLVGHKSMNYAELMLIREKGQAKGFQEVLLQNEQGNYTEGTFTNVFAVKDGLWRTPPLSDGLLAGVMRQNLIEYLMKENLFDGEVSMDKKMLESADRLYVTNSLMGLMPVNSVGEKPLNRSEKEHQRVLAALGFCGKY